MSDMALPRPGITLGAYPQRESDDAATFDTRVERFLARVRVRRGRYRVDYIRARVAAEAAGLEGASDASLRARRDELRVQMLRDGLVDELVFRCFALVREMAGRTLGMRHFDVQLLGGWVMVNGLLAEMGTGEGKSLTATLAASAASLAGIPVHIVTTNEYLAARDAREMAPLYRAMGLSVAVVDAEMDFAQRQLAYRHDIVYSTNKQIGFDYLRDTMVMGSTHGSLSLRMQLLGSKGSPLLLPGLCFAIVDEADSVLIDEARTPLLIAREIPEQDHVHIYRQAIDCARALREGEHYTIDRRSRELQLLDAAEFTLAKFGATLQGVWAGKRRRRMLLTQALHALHLYERDRNYLVCDDAVQIIDEYTGRTMPDRSWQRGLHQMIECKEGCTISAQRDALASTSFQRFFKRYRHLAGMSGTLREVRAELREVYGLEVIAVPPNRTKRYRQWPAQVLLRRTDKWRAVVDRIAGLHEQGRPVLVGTFSVSTSQHLSELLAARGLAHRVLNARNDSEEALIVAAAGAAGQITVATNMAGRGTDIKLDQRARELGGLHVVLTESNDARRIDRQLYGRAARQGEPGSGEAIVSLQDRLSLRFWPRWLVGVLMRLGLQTRFPAWMTTIITRVPQRRLERFHKSERRALMKNDAQLGRMLAFTGKLE